MPAFTLLPLRVCQTESIPRSPSRMSSPTITKIPVLPISYSDAMPLLKAMGGPVTPPEWRGALPITYHLAGSARSEDRHPLQAQPE